MRSVNDASARARTSAGDAVRGVTGAAEGAENGGVLLQDALPARSQAVMDFSESFFKVRLSKSASAQGG